MKITILGLTIEVSATASYKTRAERQDDKERRMAFRKRMNEMYDKLQASHVEMERAKV